MGWGFRTLAHWKTYSGKDNLSTVSKVKLLPYTIDSLLGLNLVENGLFKDNIIGIETFSLKNTSIIYYDQIKLDNGSIRIEALNDCNTIVNISSVSNTKKYMLRFTSAANIDFNMEVYLRSGTAPFNIISRINPIKISAHRNDYEIIFNNPTTNSKAAIIFSIKNEPVTFWLDNIELVEAVVRPTVPAEVFRFEYNTTAKIKKLALNGIFIGIDSTIYNDTLSLAPFSSKVLLKVNNIVSKISSPLPVKLLNFVINDAKDEVKVNWVTTQEINSNYYVIERSTDGKKFETIGQVISNNKVTTNNYQFKDFKPIDGTSYYRLVMVDKDGSKAYSSIIALKKNSTALFISNMAVAESKLQFQINSNAKQLLNYIIVDVVGRLFYKNSIILQKGANSITQQIESLDKNMYYLKLVTSQENIVKPFLNR